MTHKDAALAEMARVLQARRPAAGARVLEGRGAAARRPTTGIRSRCCRASASGWPATATSYRYLAESIRMHPGPGRAEGDDEDAPASAMSTCTTSAPASSRCTWGSSAERRGRRQLRALWRRARFDRRRPAAPARQHAGGRGGRRRRGCSAASRPWLGVLAAAVGGARRCSRATPGTARVRDRRRAGACLAALEPADRAGSTPRATCSLHAAQAPAKREPVRAPRACPSVLDGDTLLGEARVALPAPAGGLGRGDVAALSHLTTPDMLAELLDVLTARGSEPNRTARAHAARRAARPRGARRGLPRQHRVLRPDPRIGRCRAPCPSASCGCSPAPRTRRPPGAWRASRRCSEGGLAAAS